MKNHKIFATGIAASLAFLTSAHADYSWIGTTSSDPTVSTNWSGTPPTLGAANSGNLNIQNTTTGSALDYNNGTTSFTGNVRVGADASGSELDVTGGSLTINSSGTSTVGYHGSGTIGVSGGTFDVEGTDQFWFGNDSAATANVSGNGEFIVGDQFLLSRDGGTSTINLSGNGVFDVTGTSGTVYGANNTNGVATINLNGNGIFEQTGSSAIDLGGNFTVNFVASSLGEFSLLDASTPTLDSYITAGDFSIAGAKDTTLADYNVVGNTAGQGIIELATPVTIPEPSTWAMMLAGFATLVLVQRKRFFKA
jgi:hypothetical protein